MLDKLSRRGERFGGTRTYDLCCMRESARRHDKLSRDNQYSPAKMRSLSSFETPLRKQNACVKAPQDEGDDRSARRKKLEFSTNARVPMRGISRSLRARLSPTNPFDVAFVLLLAVIAILIVATFQLYAISNDEEVQHRYGEMIVAYYASGLTDQSLFHFRNLYVYGGLFDLVAVLLAKLLPFEPYSIRHLLSAFAGLGGIAATWATARRIAGARAGLMAAVALTLCGVWYGGMFNHTKD